MKKGKNNLYPCVVGKKYKRAYFGKSFYKMKIAKNYFYLKGKNAEKILHDLAIKTFLADWCYLNPQLPDKKELCDLLVVFDNIAIIWQIKDLKKKIRGESLLLTIE